MKKTRKNIIYKAGVLLIAVFMVLSIVPAVTADSEPDKTLDGQFNKFDVLPSGLNFGGTPQFMGLYDDPAAQRAFLPGDIIFDQPVCNPNVDPANGPFSDANGGYRAYENFWGLTADIGQVNFWGLLGYATVDDPTGMTLEIEFYPDTGTAPDTGSPVATFTGVVGTDITATNTGVIWLGWYIWYFEYDLPSDVSMTDGWISVYHPISTPPIRYVWVDAAPGYGDDYAYQAAALYYDLSIQLLEAGEPAPDCIPDVCDFEIVSINNVEDQGVMNSLPAIINITIRNNGWIPIIELKLLADVFEKVCGDSNIWCDDLEKDKYDPRWDSDNENWSVFDDPADDADDEGDTFVLQQDEFHSGTQAYRCTAGMYRSTADDDVYVGRSEAIEDDALIWEPANMSQRALTGAACATFSFWHKATGEYVLDEDDDVVLVDYGHIAYSLDDGATWTNVPTSMFAAYDNGWEQWQIKIINTAANDGHYDTVCDGCECDDDEDRTICLFRDFDAAGATFLKVKFMWHVNPCHEYEGWYIDDVCFERTEQYELELIHQTHEIIELDACSGNVYYEFPLGFDPEPGKWYMLCILGQVFAPYDCEFDLLNNELCIQFMVDDIHDIECIGITGPEMIEGLDEDLMYEVTVKNIGTFAEDDVPVDLKVARKMVEFPIEDDFETNPQGKYDMYQFIDVGPENLWRWTRGDSSIPGPRSKLPGEEAFIYADTGAYPVLKPDTGVIMLVADGMDFQVDDCEESWVFDFSVKYSVPEDCLITFFTWPTSNDVPFWWGLYNLGVWWDAGYTNDGINDNIWIDFSIDMTTAQEHHQFEEHGVIVTPEIGFGFIVITDVVCDPIGPSPDPWGGFMVDNFLLTHRYQDPSGDVVDTAYTGLMAPGDEDTVELWWNDTQYCDWVIIGDANLPDDVDPGNDKCCMQTLITSTMDEFEFESEDISCCGEGSLWHLCTSRPPVDDTFYWAGDETTGFYAPNMDDSLIGEFDATLGETDGAFLNFATYWKFFDSGDYGELYARDARGKYDWHGGPLEGWTYIDTYSGSFADWHVESEFLPPNVCSNVTEIRFRMVSNDLKESWGDDIMDESEGWYIDDIELYTVLKVPALMEDMSGGVPPAGWSQEQSGEWEQYFTSNAGGTSPEARLAWYNIIGDYAWLETSPVDTTGGMVVEFKSYVDTYSSYSINAYVWASNNGGSTWNDVTPWSNPVQYGEGPDTYSINPGMGTNTIVRFVFDGYYFYLDYWYLDDVVFLQAIPDMLFAWDDFEGDSDHFEWYAIRSCAGDFWDYTNTEYLYPFTDDYDGDHYVWWCHDYPSEGTGLNDVLWTEIDLTDPALTYARIVFAHQWIMEPGCEAWVEVSTDYDPEELMCASTADWIPLYHYGIPEGLAPAGYINPAWPNWMIENFDFNDYLGQKVYLRFRYVTPGNGMYIFPDAGWMIDGMQLIYKEMSFIDEVAPVTTMVFDDLTGTVSLFAYDPAGPASSGVCATYYKLDGGATTEYAAPFTVPEGSHTVEYWSVDCAGNEESHKSGTVVVDTTDPEITITEPVEGLYILGSKVLASRILGSGALCIGKVTIKADATDVGGISLVTFDVDGDTGYAGSAPYEYTYRGMKFGSCTATATAFDTAGRTAQDSTTFTIYSLGLL